MDIYPKQHPRYRADIDGLRAVAVVLVLLFHAGLGFPGGFIGVDVFFVISGFLITRILNQQVNAGTFSFTVFWNRRIRRIVPAAFLMAAVVLFVGILILDPVDLVNLAKSSIAQQLMAANFYFGRHTNYFATTSELYPLLHTWSLGVEEQFYLFYPWFLVFLLKGKRRNPARGILIVGVISFLAGLVLTFVLPSIAFFFLPFRAWELMIGGWLAVRTEKTMPGKQAGIISGSGLILIIASSLLLDVHVAFPGYWAVLPVMATALLILGGGGNTTAVQKMLSIPAARLVGKASYSIYLWHWPIFAFMRYWYGLNLDWTLSVAGLSLSLILGFASWKFVEEPIRKTRGSFKSAFSALVIASLLFSALAGYVAYGGGFPSRSIEHQKWEKLADLNDLDKKFGDESFEDNAIQVLRVGGGPSRKPEFAIWGDSHAMALAAVVDEIAAAHKCQGILVSRSGSPPLVGVDNSWAIEGTTLSLDEWSKESLQVLKASGIRHVMLVGRWAAYVNGIPNVMIPDLRIRPILPGEKGSPQSVFKDSLQATIQSLEDAGITTALLEQPPLQGDGIQRRTFIRSLWGVPLENERATSWEDHLDRQSDVSAAVSAVSAGGSLRVLKIRRERYEASGIPAVFSGDRPMYLDDDHLSAVGVRLLFEEEIESWIKEICDPADQNLGP
ncbi:MAG: acyltransferase family protein [Phycisphaerales bacterium]|nr:acyltransferase family protein [Phycisphaerales bacterium]